MTSTGSPRPISEGGVQGTDEESRAVETPSPASNQGGEQRGRGGVRGRGRGRQARGGYNPEADDRVLALLQEVRQERRSMDVFLDTNNPRACFCRSLYHILEDIGGDQEKLCMDRMYAIAMQYRHAKLSGGPPPCDPYNVSHDPPNGPWDLSSASTPPLTISPLLNANHHLCRPRPHTITCNRMVNFHLPPPIFSPHTLYPATSRILGVIARPNHYPVPNPQCNQPSTTTYHQL
ncbi:hypothetical protein AB205_0062270 [Aquarana catesbeiana]|uniref:Uncharacterized protein n=1 Tax=Aquarana catesbeiana TaxID=8400 RepID=A0A2G9Q3E6_AQUCT|nr:hypothetical protein AB205_0062270 [Aquarana catesbeiana]